MLTSDQPGCTGRAAGADHQHLRVARMTAAPAGRLVQRCTALAGQPSAARGGVPHLASALLLEGSQRRGDPPPSRGRGWVTPATVDHFERATSLRLPAAQPGPPGHVGRSTRSMCPYAGAPVHRTSARCQQDEGRYLPRRGILAFVQAGHAVIDPHGLERTECRRVPACRVGLDAPHGRGRAALVRDRGVRRGAELHAVHAWGSACACVVRTGRRPPTRTMLPPGRRPAGETGARRFGATPPFRCAGVDDRACAGAAPPRLAPSCWWCHRPAAAAGRAAPAHPRCPAAAARAGRGAAHRGRPGSRSWPAPPLAEGDVGPCVGAVAEGASASSPAGGKTGTRTLVQVARVGKLD